MAPIELFRMISLRAADIDNVIGPVATDQIALPALQDFALANRFEPDAQRVVETEVGQLRSLTEINRQIERDELKKWSVKLMRNRHFEFDAVVGVGEDEDEIQEIDVAAADEQAPVTRFFEDAFEWRHISYFLHPYFWGQRRAWQLRQRITVPSDPQHEQCLKAGSARVVVPVRPGFEARVLKYVDSDPKLDDRDRIPVDEDLDAEAPPGAESIWADLRTDTDRETARGNGLLIVSDGSDEVGIKDNSWHVEPIDLGRDICIRGQQYQIVSIDQDANTFRLDRNYEGPDADLVSFLVGSVPYGEPWRVTVPTQLVILREHLDKLVANPGSA